MDPTSNSSSNGAIIAIGVLVAALQKTLNGGAMAENLISVAISILGYQLPMLRGRLPSADCGIFYRNIERGEQRMVLGWLNECAILCSLHREQPPVPSPATTAAPPQVRSGQRTTPDFNHGDPEPTPLLDNRSTYSLVLNTGAAADDDDDDDDSSEDEQDSTEKENSERLAAYEAQVGRWAHATFGMINFVSSVPSSINPTGSNIVSESRTTKDQYLDQITFENENKYMISKFAGNIRKMTRRELITLVEGLWRAALKSRTNKIDIWGKRLLRDLRKWKGEAQEPTPEPDLIWRANKRAISAMSNSINSLSFDEPLESLTGAERQVRRLWLDCLFGKDAHPTLDDIAHIKSGDFSHLSTDLLKHYTAYKAAAYTLQTLDQAKEHEDYCVVAGYSRDSLSNLLNTLGLRSPVNDLKSAHAEHTGEGGPFSARKTFHWWSAALRCILEIAIAAMLTAILGMGPLVAMSTSRLLLVRAGFFPVGAPCADHFIEDAEVFSNGSGRDEWWALIKLRQPLHVWTQLGSLALAELSIVISVWFLVENQHESIGYYYVCNDSRLSVWLPQAIGAIVSVMVVLAGLAMVAPHAIRDKFRPLYYYVEKHSLAVRVPEDSFPSKSDKHGDHSNHDNHDDDDGSSSTRTRSSFSTGSLYESLNRSLGIKKQTRRPTKIFSRTILKDYPAISGYEWAYMIVCVMIATVVACYAFLSKERFNQTVYEFSALVLWGFGEAMNPHMRQGRNIVTHEIIAYIMAFISLLVGATCGQGRKFTLGA
ncbi:uncharacterized protein BJ171DRAFT_524663 [Polychytrium aggregatum]|uniref:uncharacterized protein n=1 Tax=Polychytrium aggregatum TaxID=110093 RepID=UPI0022FEA456|nr:uncharacterized protein BJ171DRAFT_524663 [Polychytrium aggregatum]KAI9193637.1 hypothetical protein BJ171DRAFT_524663 [Polychytrium aggregatum]